MAILSARFVEQVEQLHQTIQHHCHTAQTQLSKAQAGLNTAVHDLDIHPKVAIYSGLFIVTIFWVASAITHQLRNRLRNRDASPNTPNLEKRSPFRAPDRPPGGTEIAFPPHPYMCH
jgi:hypothetical protein